MKAVVPVCFANHAGQAVFGPRIKCTRLGIRQSAPYQDAKLASTLGEEIAIKGIVAFLEEQFLAAVAALRHMMGEAGNHGAGDAGHGRMLRQVVH